MIITSIERQKKNRRRVSLFLDGAFAFGVNEDVVYRYGLCKGMELGEPLRREIEEYDNRVQAKIVAERLIATRMRSEQEIREHLVLKGFPEEIADETINDFRRVRLLDDGEFARAWIRDRLRLRPRAAAMLRVELRRKGVADMLIDQALGELFADKDEAEIARELADSYCRKHPGLDGIVLKRRLASFLQRKGFSASVVYPVIENVE
ncbi:MAG: RecX family transcriptional regulator [Bacteroidetes bacterium]|nr:RecX family transcriptional regulator [Bacteroidota bacterium]